ncbi:trigger factor [Candidatus Peribacteria bacterium RIFCSPHIGHO2_02_FULL_53_20]|nr:MAG: trigger factor [Candidatus Peribacteria bacterium RIFCSPHIGHO2_02_FULL_53_20]OGJ68075.1 MAG: trigger factor [Candidatus Peribacteria bacterium RIFCSPLOWO2_01_FULL_53_10]OGJ73237.1 MAG: trigger factor [Candidatus Peribacteria bacterium RIFCSPLOWO2_12_FULL_53_10]
MTPQITIKRLPKAKIECRAVFTAEETAGAEKRALEAIGTQTNLPGFRPGKAPAELVREKADPEKLLEETVRVLLPDVMQSAIKEHQIAPIIPPNAAIEKTSPLSIVLTFIERPKVSVKAGKIKVEKKEMKIEDKDIDRMIESLMVEHQISTAVERAAASGDRLMLDVRGEDDKGTLIPGSEMKGRPVVIGSKALIPGFEDQLVGLKTGDKKSFPLKFPEKYHAEHLAGTPVTFHVEVKSVEEVKSPELSDAFVKEKFQMENAAALKDRIHSGMKEQEDRIEKQRREGSLFEAILKATSVDLADELIEDEFRNLIEDFAGSLKEQGMTLEQWMEKSKKTAKDLEADMRKRATERLTLRMGIQQLIQDKEITVSDDDMHKAIQELVSQLDTEKRLEIAPLYAKGAKNYEQLKWQKMVEKLMEELLS